MAEVSGASRVTDATLSSGSFASRRGVAVRVVGCAGAESAAEDCEPYLDRTSCMYIVAAHASGSAGGRLFGLGVGMASTLD